MKKPNQPHLFFRFITKSYYLLKERRLPWRVNQWLSKLQLNTLRFYYDYKALNTKPIRTSESYPAFELHMLLGHKHVGMCIWSVKSFLHFSGIPFHVVLHDDGTLTTKDLNNLRAHLINVTIFQKLDADHILKAKLSALPNCLEYRFTSKDISDHRGTRYNMRIFSIRLFDFNLLSNSMKTLVLDADVLFFKTPTEIIDWAKDPNSENSIYSVEQYLPIRNIRNEIIDYERKIPTPTDANAGLLCFSKTAFDLVEIDRWIESHKDLMDKYATFEQAAYNYLIKKKGDCAPLPDSYSFNYTDNSVSATHFAIKILFFKNLCRLVKDLSK